MSMRCIENSSLEDWRVIDSGGFGHVYKVKHRQWCSDVAIKLLRCDDSKAVLREIDMMRRGSSPYVIQVLGIFKGRLPSHPVSIQLGLVMEFMERGSLAFLQKTLAGPPPWPLVFRLAHQVALGMNFLHCLSPPMLHLDLKPSNVLLDPYLNAKLTDFGLSRFYHSSTRLSKDTGMKEGGTLPYMPPEAFDLNYKPTQASDIYSYGILLWSIVSGTKPYENATSSIVRILVPEGQRPSLAEIRSQDIGVAGLEVLMALMEKCWEGTPKQRPSSYDCTMETKELYKMHKHAIVDVVHQVLKELEEGFIEQVQEFHISEASAAGVMRKEVNLFHSVPTGPSPVQEIAGGLTGNQRVNPRLKDSPSHRPVNACEVDSSAMGPKVKRSSVQPISSSQPASSSVHSSHRSHHNREQNKLPGLFRQLLSCYPSICRPENYVKISDVTGIQYGNNNTMNINNPGLRERRRHPTAPPSVDFSSMQSGRRLDKKEG